MNTFTFNTISNETKEEFTLDYIKADKFMIYLLFIHWLIATFVTSHAYSTYIYGFINGGAIFVINFILYKLYNGENIFRYSAAISLMLFSLIFVQQYLGRIEMHFHIFIAMALLTVYKDMYPVIIASITSIIHHALFNYLQINNVYVFDMPIQIFNYGCGWDIVILHAIFVVAEGLILSYIIREQILTFTSLVESKQKLKKEVDLSKRLSKEAQQFASALDESSIVSKTDINGNITEFIGLRNDITETENYKKILKDTLDDKSKSLDENINYISQ